MTVRRCFETLYRNFVTLIDRNSNRIGCGLSLHRLSIFENDVLRDQESLGTFYHRDPIYVGFRRFPEVGTVARWTVKRPRNPRYRNFHLAESSHLPR